jgi:poly(hydroxyalkanoate) depolymerase family esterase
MTEETIGENRYLKFVPPNPSGEKLPLLVMLHGCSQSPEQFASETRMNELARSEKFIVVYPDQANTSQRFQCWTFYRELQRSSEEGEAGLIRTIVKAVSTRHAVDEQRIYLAGFSAGGAMAAQLAATFPKLFAAVGIHSGMEYGVADGAFEAVEAMEKGGPNPEETGREAYVAMGNRADPVPTIVLHGLDDEIVAPVNGRQAAEQAAQTLDLIGDGIDDDYIDYVPDSVITDSTPGHPSVRREYRYSDGRLGVVEYRIEGLAHSWSGGSRNGVYTDPRAPDASKIIWDFFKRHTLDTVDENVQPLPSISIDTARSIVLVGNSVSFKANPANADFRFEWNFGDGTKKQGQSVSHVFRKPGKYSVRLNLIHQGRTRKTSRTITVVEP